MIAGIGTDIVAIARMDEFWQRHGQRALAKLLAPDERADCLAASEPARFLAKRFAAKEALGKAFGTGIPEGVIAPEAANNSVVGGALIPTFALGIPGSGAAAILMGGMMFQGLRPGPRLFMEQLPLIQTLAVYLLFGCALMGLFGGAIALTLYRITRVPLGVLVPVTIVTSAVGAYAARTEVFDVGVMMGAGLFGYLLLRNGYPLAGVVLGLVLGQPAEDYLIQSLEMSGGEWSILFASPLAKTLWGMIVLSLGASQLLAWRERSLAARRSMIR